MSSSVPALHSASSAQKYGACGRYSASNALVGFLEQPCYLQVERAPCGWHRMASCVFCRCGALATLRSLSPSSAYCGTHSWGSNGSQPRIAEPTSVLINGISRAHMFFRTFPMVPRHIPYFIKILLCTLTHNGKPTPSMGSNAFFDKVFTSYTKLVRSS